MQKSAADECAGRETYQAKKYLMQEIVLYGKSKNTHQGYNANQKCTGQDP